MENWAEKRASFIAKLEQHEKFFSEIFTIDKDGIIIGFQERNILYDLRQRNNVILDKLRSRSFTVAVIGLEKAGKSTLSNALIKSEILPEYTERCTYTTTELRAGERNEAEITFYSNEEFTKIFQDMLNSAGYEPPADFRTLTPENFRHYWKTVSSDETKRALYERNNGKTDEDIISILEGSRIISSLLGQPAKKFSWDSEHGSSDFQLYITGINGYTEDRKLIRTAHPYAVKKVVITSRELGSMSNIILYDVPGFDSPTELHKKQTEEKLREADAIILVLNAGHTPNINSTQLDMLRKVRDIDGIKLSDKTFIFGNKIDTVGNSNLARDNTLTLKNDAERYSIAQPERVITGSAKAYLEKLGLLSPDEKERGKINALKNLYRCGISDGINELREAIEIYYDNERFEILQKRAEKVISETIEFLRGILADYTPEVLDSLETGGKYMLELKSKAVIFDRKANEIVNDYTQTISTEKPFSKKLIDSIEVIYPLSENFSDIINDVKSTGIMDADGVVQLSAINSRLREKVHQLFMRNLVSTASVIVNDKQDEIRAQLAAEFLNSMGMDENSDSKAELEESVNKLFDELLIKNGEQCRFNSLIERFASGLVETLILMPFAEYERLEKVRRTLPELFSLALYYSMPSAGENNPEISDVYDEGLKFFGRILAHEQTEEKSEEHEISGTEEILQKFFADNAEIILKGLRFDNVRIFPFYEWAGLFTNAGVKLNKMPQELESSLENLFYKADWENLTKYEREQAITEAIKNYLGSSENEISGLNIKLEEFNRTASNHKALSDDEILAILNEDIKILRDLTAKAVIRAIDLERAFISVIVKNVNFIREGITAPGEGSRKFDEWINLNVRKIKEKDFARIERDNRDNQTRKTIAAAIQKILNGMG
ncbi:MAG: dynamin family protein [Synergistaceae bacterium]|nr:dynamin family protein [Synergistaceae bacterium]